MSEAIQKIDDLSQNLLATNAQVQALKLEIEAFGLQKYEAGYAAGVAASGGDKIYSQAELDAALIEKASAVKAELKAKYEEAQAKETEIEKAVFGE